MMSAEAELYNNVNEVAVSFSLSARNVEETAAASPVRLAAAEIEHDVSYSRWWDPHSFEFESGVTLSSRRAESDILTEKRVGRLRVVADLRHPKHEIELDQDAYISHISVEGTFGMEGALQIVKDVKGDGHPLLGPLFLVENSGGFESSFPSQQDSLVFEHRDIKEIANKIVSKPLEDVVDLGRGLVALQMKVVDEIHYSSLGEVVGPAGE